MIHRTKFWHLCTRLLPILLGVLAVGGLLLAGQPAAAAVGAGNCMEDRFFNATGGHLVCTANDVRIARATNISVDSCIRGGPVTFTADFEVLLGAQARYDIGLYFDVNGDPENDGALTGQCAVNTISLPNSNAFINLDPSPDTCGDIDAAHNPQLVRLTITTACQDSDGDGKLNLPNCVSWRQPGSNEVCDDPSDAFPGSPSKCRCDIGFNVDILVERPNIGIEKSANPTSVNEPGASVEFTVTVTNPALYTTVTLGTIVDDPDNDTNTNNSTTYAAATICQTASLGPGASTTCTFTRTVSGDQGDVITDRACVSGTDSNGSPVGPTCDTAEVTIVGVAPSASLTKIATKAIVTFEVKVQNTSRAEALTLDKLCDDKFGAIATSGGATCPEAPGAILKTTCSVPQTLAINGGTYTCSFDAEVSIGSAHLDTVTGTVSDDDTNSIFPAGSATVTITTSHNP